MDDARQIADLKALGIAEARQSEDEISQRFLDVPAEPFVPHFAPPSAADSGRTKAPYKGMPVIARL